MHRSVSPAPQILVVEHQANAGIGLVGERLLALGAELTQVGPDRGLPVPATLAGYDGLVVLGGAMGPTEDAAAPWLPAVRRLMARAVAEEFPLLGICLGAQLLTTVAGGRVSPMVAGPEIGLTELTVTEPGTHDPLLAGLSPTVRALQWHWLESAELPAGAVPLMGSAGCANQAFRVGPRAWGLQFHLEGLAQTAVDWVEEDPESLMQLGIDADAEVMTPVRAAEQELRETWSPVADRWLGVVQDHKSLYSRSGTSSP